MNLWDKFVELVTGHFEFLETEFHFERKEVKSPFIFYRSDKVEVRVYYSIAKHHELDLGIRRLGDDPRTVPSLHIQGLIMLSDWRLAEKCRLVYPSTEESLEVEVQRMAELLKKYGSSVLNGDSRDFERIERLSKERWEEINELAKQNQTKNRIKKQ